MKHQNWLIAALVAALLLLGAYYRFDMRWMDFGTGDRLAYWSVPRAALLGYGFYDMAWLAEAQRDAGYVDPLPQGKPYPVQLIWSPAPVYLWLLPLSALSFTASCLLWIGLSVLVVALAALHFNRFLPRPLPQGVALLTPALGLPLVGAMFWGQFSPVMGAVLIFSWLAYRRNRDVATGILLFVLLIKPHLVALSLLLFAVVVIRQRRWRVALSFGGMAALQGVGAFLLDPSWLAGWASQGTPTRWYTFSLVDMLALRTDSGDEVRYLVVLLGVAWALWHFRRARTLEPRVLGESVLLSILFGPYVWHHDLALLLIPALWIVGRFWNPVRHRLLLLLPALAVGVEGWSQLTYGPPAAVTPYLLYLCLFVLFWIIGERWADPAAGHPLRPPSTHRLGRVPS